TAQDQDQTESAQGGQNVDHHIEQRSTVGLRVSLAIEHASQQAQENETHVRDGRIRKHTLEILLHDRSQVTQSQRQHSHDQQHGLPVHGNTVQSLNQEAHGYGKSSQFGSSTDDQGNGSRSALIDVRCPHMERSSRQFEGQTCHNKHHTEDQSQTLGLTVSDDFSDTWEFQMAGSAKNHGHTVQ